MEGWIGAGPSASGTLIHGDRGVRHTHARDLAAYLAAPRPRVRAAVREELSPSDLARESLMMGFRLRAGPDPRVFARRFGAEIEALTPETLARWRGRGFFDPEAPAGSLAPSREGLLFLNGFLRDAVLEMDALWEQ